jgi:hypothetical protein
MAVRSLDPSRASGTAASLGPATLAVVLPHQQRDVAGFNRSVDADRRRRLAISLTVITHDDPAAIGPLHELGVVDFSHRSTTPT